MMAIAKMAIPHTWPGDGLRQTCVSSNRWRSVVSDIVTRKGQPIEKEYGKKWVIVGERGQIYRFVVCGK
jgi:hypothetical protein